MRGINLHEDWGWSNAPRIVGAGTAILAGSAIAGGSSLLGSGKSSSASKSAAEESYYATQLATDTEKQLYQQTASSLAPYNTYGQGVLYPMAALTAQTPGQSYLDQASQWQQQAGNYLTQAAGMTPPSQMTEAYLQNTPGYQFQLQQGLQATQAAAAARGLGVSGASLKGAATYATGLADSNYQNQFNNAQTAWQDVMNQGVQAQNLGSGYLSSAGTAQAMQAQQYSQLANIANLGENAAAQTGQAASQYGSQQASSLASGSQQYGNYLSQAGQAQAAGTAGVGNAATSGVNNYLSYSTLQQLLGGTGGTGGFGNGTGYVDTGSWTTS